MGDATPAVPGRVRRARGARRPSARPAARSLGARPVSSRRGARRPPKRSAAALVASLAAFCVIAAACGGGDDGATALETTGLEAAPVGAESAGSALANRVAAGIAAAGGDPQSLQGPNPCNLPGAADAEPITVAYVGPNLAELEAVGLETTEVEDLSLIIAAYVNQVNFSGGIRGRCVELLTYLWSLSDPTASFAHICSELPERRPVLHFALTVPEATLQCATLDSQITTVGLFTAVPEATLVQARGRLFVDDGAFEPLMLGSLRDAAAAGVIDHSDRIGFLQGSNAAVSTSALEVALREERTGRSMAAPPAANLMFLEDRIRRLDIDVAASVIIPALYGDLMLLLTEKQIRLLEADLSDEELQEAAQNLATLPPAMAAIYLDIEDFYSETAARFRDDGVTAVAAIAGWSDLRRMMRAAERIDWTPKWIANDIQPATVLMADIPRRQAENLVQVSARRAAGDEIPELDAGCITLRNTAVEAPPFAYRPHSDAWNLATSTCDYLDVTFGAISRADEPITSDSVLSALDDTDYAAPYGGRITFSRTDRGGAERFRVLEPDVDCVLNFWGCMRATTDWITPPAP